MEHEMASGTKHIAISPAVQNIIDQAKALPDDELEVLIIEIDKLVL
jgi:hypothetical protein